MPVLEKLDEPAAPSPALLSSIAALACGHVTMWLALQASRLQMDTKNNGCF